MSSEPAPQPTNRPKEGEKVQPLGYLARVAFHPEIRLSDNRKGYEFLKTLSEVFDPTRTDFKGETWEFVQPLGSSPNCVLAVTVLPAVLQFVASLPENPLEWYETRFLLLLEKFRAFFKPKMVLQSSATVTGLLPVDGDARAFLAGHVARLNQKIAPLGRPIHLFGLRFFFPPFKTAALAKNGAKGKRKKPTETVTDWQVNVRIESLLEDPSKLFLEAEADWVNPTEWDSAAETRIQQHLATVWEFLENNVIAFLKQKPEEKQGA